MEKIVTTSNLRQFAAVREEGLRLPVRAVLLTFHGLGWRDMDPPVSGLDRECSERGILPVFPYYGCWSWMNDTAVRLTGQIVGAVYEKYQLDSSVPLIASGGSMGGLASLIYTRWAGEMTNGVPIPSACAADSPVCDLPYHYTEREDLPRTLVSAFGHYSIPLAEAMKTASPYHQADQMPDIPYFIVHGTADTAVSKTHHSDRLVPRLKERHRVEYLQVEGMEHCAMPPDAYARYRDFIWTHSGLLHSAPAMSE